MKHYERLIETPIGTLIAVTDGEAIRILDFADDAPKIEPSDHPLLLQLSNELEEYFAGNRTVFTLPLNPNGTSFQKEVWETLLTIPYGKTISYASEAERFGNPKATRAVANANGRNPIAILIPCHRVIATGGGLGGYSGGLWRKEFLLSLEKDDF
ncbi:methylated-DNA--[protein]-cysteine S-methyltransferase [Sulfuricurvum sp.]|uniref:methylated-DNA--[protein]-cysteine S-methyltransferase n=1 Tax=Sulfuricurvum sp. TaxID=2025608 RepID=UPI002610AB71|nr:methylated-DNA--[protein]-cysteine S-methyltransferase [Sulfuricurvum sp.]MDD2266872.1 methylated-DNA--[protein]-cysteine S-methyltransferase [Sulfuricurvum sp.]MDD2784481.1 methylated-DNA--[protein]-cysteine S-methyltransferase [Sulfuricurvum sp.]